MCLFVLLYLFGLLVFAGVFGVYLNVCLWVWFVVGCFAVCCFVGLNWFACCLRVG